MYMVIRFKCFWVSRLIQITKHTRGVRYWWTFSIFPNKLENFTNSHSVFIFSPQKKIKTGKYKSAESIKKPFPSFYIPKYGATSWTAAHCWSLVARGGTKRGRTPVGGRGDAPRWRGISAETCTGESVHTPSTANLFDDRRRIVQSKSAVFQQRLANIRGTSH